MFLDYDFNGFQFLYTLKFKKKLEKKIKTFVINIQKTLNELASL